MNWNMWVRQLHRWLSIVFTMAVVITFIVLQTENPPMWVSFVSLPPLFLLMFSGLYLFALPYVARRRVGGRSQA